MRWIALTLLLSWMFAPTAVAQSLPPIRPPALRSGDTVRIIAPAGTLERTRVELARSRLVRMDFRVQVPENLYRKRGYLAGDDDVRAEELMNAFRDPAVKAVFPGAGGYGTTRLLDLLDYEVIRRNPKILLGFSDITGLHLAIQRKTGLITFHGPVVTYGLGSRENLTPFSKEFLWRALLYKSYFDWAGDPTEDGYTYVVPPDVGTVRTLSPGQARGRLTGGNLSLVCALMGTEYEIQTEGRVLFLEDVNEEPYRIDRYLSQLRLAGKFDNVAAVILGQFTGCSSSKGNNSLTLEQVLADYFDGLGVPVIANFPAGHYRHNATLPINGLIQVDADTRIVQLLDNPVTTGLEAPDPSEMQMASDTEDPPQEEPESTTESGPIGLPDDHFEPLPRPAPATRPVDEEILRRIP